MTQVTNVESFITQRESVSAKLLSEISVINKCFSDSADEFEDEDNYNKFILFSVYRGIEDCIELIFADRICNSVSKEYIQMIKPRFSSNFIDWNVLNALVNEYGSITVITYRDLYDYIKTSELSIIKSKINSVSDITNSRYKACDVVNFGFISDKYNYSKNNRNKLLHSLIKSSDYSRIAVIYALIVYSYFMLLLDEKN